MTDHAEGFRGALLGLALGDAVGTTLEFRKPGTFQSIDDMLGGGPFRLKPGEWTDDTSMALCLAESLVETGTFDPVDQLRRYIRWWREGHLASNGVCFDIGNTVRDALAKFERHGRADSGGTGERTAGNGSIMRLAPVPLFYVDRAEDAIERSGESSLTTHALPVCVDACRYLGALIVGAVRGTSKDELLGDLYTPVPGYWSRRPLHADIDAIARGSFKRREPPAIAGSGHVVRSLEAALWAFHRTSSFRDGCLAAVNLGDDADTTGAVYGQLAGAYYGERELPEEWRERLAKRELIASFADRLAAQPS